MNEDDKFQADYAMGDAIRSSNRIFSNMATINMNNNNLVRDANGQILCSFPPSEGEIADDAELERFRFLSQPFPKKKDIGESQDEFTARSLDHSQGLRSAYQYVDRAEETKQFVDLRRELIDMTTGATPPQLSDDELAHGIKDQKSFLSNEVAASGYFMFLLFHNEPEYQSPNRSLGINFCSAFRKGVSIIGAKRQGDESTSFSLNVLYEAKMANDRRYPVMEFLCPLEGGEFAMDMSNAFKHLVYITDVGILAAIWSTTLEDEQVKKTIFEVHKNISTFELEANRIAAGEGSKLKNFRNVLAVKPKSASTTASAAANRKTKSLYRMSGLFNQRCSSAFEMARNEESSTTMTTTLGPVIAGAMCKQGQRVNIWPEDLVVRAFTFNLGVKIASDKNSITIESIRIEARDIQRLIFDNQDIHSPTLEDAVSLFIKVYEEIFDGKITGAMTIQMDTIKSLRLDFEVTNGVSEADIQTRWESVLVLLCQDSFFNTALSEPVDILSIRSRILQFQYIMDNRKIRSMMLDATTKGFKRDVNGMLKNTPPFTLTPSGHASICKTTLKQRAASWEFQTKPNCTYLPACKFFHTQEEFLAAGINAKNVKKIAVEQGVRKAPNEDWGKIGSGKK